MVIGFLSEILGEDHLNGFKKVLLGPKNMRSCAPSDCSLTTESNVVTIVGDRCGQLAGDSLALVRGFIY